MNLTPVFEIVREGYRHGLELTEADARARVGSQSLPLYELRPVELPVVFILIDRPNDPDGAPMTDSVYATIEAARAAQAGNPDIEIEIVEVKG